MGRVASSINPRPRSDPTSLGPDSWKRKRKERVNHSAYDLPNVDSHGILFALVAVVFVVSPLTQWALGR